MVTLYCRRETILPVQRQRQKNLPAPFRNYRPARFTQASESLVLGAYDARG